MWYTPFLIGLAASIHCIAMCGPLASLVSNTGKNVLWKRMLYNIGRVATYGLLGALISFLGGFAALTGLQQWLSFSVGALLLGVGLTGISISPPKMISRPLAALSGLLKTRFALLRAIKKPYGIFAMGMINGLLPCGMTWLALGYCTTLQWPLDGFLAMVFFGLGTLPVMLGFASLLKTLTTRFQISFQYIQTVLLIASGCVLIARTFTSPDITPPSIDTGGIPICRTN